MPGLVPSRRSCSSAEEDSTSDREQETSSQTLSPPPLDSNKRRRLDVTHTREHQPGAIVRITLTNFVTYSSATFFPGAALNMVIGPNGTGKSTLVCAICLGLGWGTKHLGRAKDIGEFVKHGSSEAMIEIELKGYPGKTNSVIRRQIKREGNKSTYFVDGSSETQSNVLALARGFSIQVDNLCQFLPQDRVVEFAAMDPILTLDSTQHAAAPLQMTKWHDELKVLRKEQCIAEKERAEVQSNLANLESRQNLQRADVERIREREELVEQIASLERLRPTADAFWSQAVLNDARTRAREAKADEQQLKAAVAPALRAVNAKQDYKVAIDEVVATKKKVLDRAEASIGKVLSDKDELTKLIEDCVIKRDAERKSDALRKRNVGMAQTEIKHIENLMKDEPVVFDASEFNARTREKKREINELRQEVETMKQGEQERRELCRVKAGRIETARKELANLKSKAGQQMTKLEAASRDTAVAWKWVQENRTRFKSEVYGPAIIECIITDQRFVSAIESLMQKSQLFSITCTDPSDFDILDDQLRNRMKLSDIRLRSTRNPLSNWRPPISKEEMSKLGLHSWTLDYIKGPEPVLSLLCEEAKLHATAVITQERTDQHEALTASTIQNWVTTTQHYQITKRREYEGFASTKVQSLKPAEWWKDHAVDHHAEHELNENIEGWTSEQDEMRKQGDQAMAKQKDLEKQTKALEEELEAIENEKAAIQVTSGKYRALPSSLQTAKHKLEALRKEGAEMHGRLQINRMEETDYVLKKAQKAILYCNFVESYRTEYAKYISVCVAQIEAISDVEELKARNQVVHDELIAKQKSFADLDKAFKDARTNSKRLQTLAVKSYDDHPGLQEYYDSLSEADKSRTPEDLAQEIDSQRARLELLQEGDPRAIREYEARAKEIERLQRSVTDNEDALTTLEQSITIIRAQWEPQLDALVAKISTAFALSFEKMGCAGEVVIHKDGDGGRDFEGWGIHRMVRFRAGEQMSVLDSHRQSGGERAVSTIFYLMALQSLSQAPFRVVDEINQGMDPRNERMVHERMVDIACGSASKQVQEDGEESIDGGDEISQGSQYFLITPKLLNDLKYSEGMKVHCIASGEFMPEDDAELNFAKLLPQVRKAMAARRAANGLVGVVGA